MSDEIPIREYLVAEAAKQADQYGQEEKAFADPYLAYEAGYLEACRKLLPAVDALEVYATRMDDGGTARKALTEIRKGN